MVLGRILDLQSFWPRSASLTNPASFVLPLLPSKLPATGLTVATLSDSVACTVKSWLLQFSPFGEWQFRLGRNAVVGGFG